MLEEKMFPLAYVFPSGRSYARRNFWSLNNLLLVGCLSILFLTLLPTFPSQHRWHSLYGDSEQQEYHVHHRHCLHATWEVLSTHAKKEKEIQVLMLWKEFRGKYLTFKVPMEVNFILHQRISRLSPKHMWRKLCINHLGWWWWHRVRGLSKRYR